MSERPIQTTSRLACPVCGTPGTYRYQGLTDRLYAVGGNWAFRQCPAECCGSLWLDPVPIDADIPKLYETYYTHSNPKHVSVLRRTVNDAKLFYLKLVFGPKDKGRWAYRSLAHRLFSIAMPSLAAEINAQAMDLIVEKEGQLLEVGFGSARALRVLTELGWNAIGLEQDQTAVALAIERGGQAIRGSVSDSIHERESFDAVVASHVIEHLLDIHKFFRDVHRLLKPKGVVSFYTPNIESHSHAHFKSNWFPLDPPRHICLFTARALRSLLANHGFSDINITSSVRGAPAIRVLSNRISSQMRARLPFSPNGPWEMISAIAAPYLASAQVRGNPLAGEELRVFARKAQ